MLDFQCKFCESDVQADYSLIGEFVSCPECDEVVVVPDPLLVYGADHHGFIIERLRASTLLWNTYQASPAGGELNGKRVERVLLRIPTSFFLKRLTDFDRFCDIVVKSGTMGVKGVSPLLTHSTVHGKTYFVFEYFPSMDLNSFIARTGPLDLINSLRIVRRCALALRDAWKKESVIHQNIIPHNIRVNANLDIRVMNLGLSQFLLEDRSLLEQGFNIWDQRYISPEFALKGKGDTPSCDIYALGMVFFFLLTGNHPYSLMPEEKIPESPIPDLKSELPLISDEAKSLFQLMVAKRVPLRFNNWDEVLERVNALLHKTKRPVDGVGDAYSKLKTRTDRRKPVALAPVISITSDKRKVKRSDFRGPAETRETIAKPVLHIRKTRHIKAIMRGKRGDSSFFERYRLLWIMLALALLLLIVLLFLNR